MIFITGDTHGDFTRFNTHIFPEQKEMTKDDYVIVCGDFGIWDNSKREHCWLDRLTDFFEEVMERCQFDYWFFGHYHDDRALMRKYILLYEQILLIEPN